MKSINFHLLKLLPLQPNRMNLNIDLDWIKRQRKGRISKSYHTFSDETVWRTVFWFFIYSNLLTHTSSFCWCVSEKIIVFFVKIHLSFQKWVQILIASSFNWPIDDLCYIVFIFSFATYCHSIYLFTFHLLIFFLFLNSTS